MYKAKYLSPMIPSFDMRETFHFFCDVLGFSPVMDTEEYAICIKDNLSIHILRAGNNIGQMEFYLEVDNIDVFWTSIKDKVKGLKHREPFDRDYGMREVHLEVPKTNALLFVGQQIQQ